MDIFDEKDRRYLFFVAEAAKLGTGARFKERGGLKNPAAVAAAIGRKGAEKFATLSTAGRRK